MSESNLTSFADHLHRWRGQNISYTEMARMVTDMGQPTTRHSVRRFFAGGGSSMGIEHQMAPSQPIVPWGVGGAKLVKPSTQEDTEIVLFGSDFHFPYQDDECIEAFLNLIHKVKPHRVVLNGDLNDFFQLSRFNRAQERLDTLQEEIDQAVVFRNMVRAEAPDAVIDETEGNHDNRIINFVLCNAKPLHTLRALDPARLFGYDDLGINWHPGAGFRLRPEFLVKHGTVVRQEAGATAKAEMLATGISGISGHTHRMITYRKHGYTQRQWTEQGCLCRLDADYIVGVPNWVRGCAVGEFSTKSPFYVVHEVPFVEGEFRLFSR